MTLKVDQNYLVTLSMIVVVLGVVVAAGVLGVNDDQLPTRELLGGLLVLAGRLITSE